MKSENIKEIFESKHADMQLDNDMKSKNDDICFTSKTI